MSLKNDRGSSVPFKPSLAQAIAFWCRPRTAFAAAHPVGARIIGGFSM
jgi:hypothetical protein